MLLGLALNMASYFVMGPVGIFGEYFQRSLETDAGIVMSQVSANVDNLPTRWPPSPRCSG